MLSEEELKALERMNNKWWSLSLFDRCLKVWDRLPDLLVRLLGLMMILGGLVALGAMFGIPSCRHLLERIAEFIRS